MKKWIGVLLISCILFLSTGCQTQQTTAIGLVPLDSRPCNTQYAVLLGEMAGYEVLIPEYGLLDAFTIASDTDALWQWLDKQQCEHYILFTNQLLNGGLINSRSLTQYQDMDTFFTNLERFIAGHTDSTITILSVLPRLLPSQYDTALWQYQKELATYGGSIDQALQQNQPLPSRPDGVPEELVDQYLALYQTNYELIQRLMSYTDAHVSLVIGQDDAQQYCPSNIVYRAIGEQAGEHVTLLHGADELTMLTLARYAAEPVALNIVYSDETFTDAYYPYEGADLASIIAEKAAYANITVDSHAQDTVIIYTDSASLERTTALLEAAYDGYLGVADIAYTNKGDVALTDVLLTNDVFQTVTCYSGWNTASNTIGTVLAHYQISKQYVDTKDAAKAALAFKLTRYSEDQIYQGHISNNLRGQLSQAKQMDYTTAFVDAAAYEVATNTLTKAFAPYGEKLKALAVGEQQILPGYTFRCKGADYMVSFPWMRAFEIEAEWDIK